MKKIHTLFVLSALSLAALTSTLAPSAAQAEPVSVLLHPGGALVQEETKLEPGKDGKTITLPLPLAADPQTVVITVPGHDVASLRFSQTVADDSSAVSTLRVRLEEVNKAISVAENSKLDQDARRNFWRYPPILLDKPEDLTKLDALLRTQQSQTAQTNAALDAELEKLRAEAEFLRSQMTEAGDSPLAREAVLELAESTNGPVTVRYAYTLDNVGWRPMYRIEALPAANQVKITLEAELWQQSGDDWNNVPLTLSTANARQAMSPPSLAAWVIQPQPVRPMPRTASADMLMAAPAQMNGDMMEMKTSRAPHYAEGATFQSWDMGKRTVPAGSSMRLALNHDTLKAEFSHILRPSRSETAFLAAKLDMPEARHLPEGEALFLVDGVPVGKSPFSLADDDRRVYFGSDPLVTALMKKDSQQSGTQGLIDRKQNYTWDWTITVFNKHNRPVKVRIEDPAPETRDQQIQVTLTSKPEPTKEDQSLVWNLDVPASKSSTIRHSVSFTAPTDMPIWEGR